MDIKKIANLLLNFTLNRLAEILGIIITLGGILLFLSLATYSPTDPNFIFPENTEIKNFLGFYGSFISDLFFQSFGLVAYLISFTLIMTGINILRTKDFFLIIENLFFIIVYTILSTLFLSYFYSDAFVLYINGNGGFVGNFLNQTFLSSLIGINESIVYYLIIVLTSIFFLISINFSPKTFYKFTKKFLHKFFINEKQNYTDKSEIIDEYIPQEEIKNLIQEDLPFIKAENNKDKGARIEITFPEA